MFGFKFEYNEIEVKPRTFEACKMSSSREDIISGNQRPGTVVPVSWHRTVSFCHGTRTSHDELLALTSSH